MGITPNQQKQFSIINNLLIELAFKQKKSIFYIENVYGAKIQQLKKEVAKLNEQGFENQANAKLLLLVGRLRAELARMI